MVARKYYKMLAAIRTHYVRAFATVYGRNGLNEDTILRNAIWEEMIADTSARAASPDVAALTQQIDKLLIDTAPTTPKAKAPPKEAPGAPARPVRPVEEASTDGEEDTKLTPEQRLRRQLTTTQEKLDKIRARMGSARQTQKQKEKDPEEADKLAAKIAEIEGKLAAKAGGGKRVRAEPEPKPAEEAPKPVEEEKPAKKAKKVKAEEPEEKKAEHMPKWTPTWLKHFKAAADAAKREVTDAEKVAFKTRINELTDAQYKEWTPAEHCKAYFDAFKTPEVALAPAPEPPKIERKVEEEDEDVWPVKLRGDDYVVGDKSHKVYKVTPDGDELIDSDLDLINEVLEELGRQ